MISSDRGCHWSIYRIMNSDGMSYHVWLTLYSRIFASYPFFSYCIIFPRTLYMGLGKSIYPDDTWCSDFFCWNLRILHSGMPRRVSEACIKSLTHGEEFPIFTDRFSSFYFFCDTRIRHSRKYPLSQRSIP